MKTRYDFYSSKVLLLVFNATFFFARCAVSFDAPSPESPACVLNFTSFPYQPQGECINHLRKIKEWSSFPTSLCCQNALTIFSKALALQATIGDQGNLFLEENQWRNCSGPFQRQHSVSIQSCGFNHLYYGSRTCSRLSLSNITQDSAFLDAVRHCSTFRNTYDEHCRNCTDAILAARDHIVDHLGITKNSTERAICGVAVVISIAVGRMNDLSYVDDLYRCFPGVDVYDPSYVKVDYSLAKTVLAVLIAVTVMLMVIMLIKYVIKSKKQDFKQIKAKEISTWSGLYRFSKAEIVNAINFGNERKCLGRGSAGQVYKGILPSGQAVAIKHIYKSINSDSFNREVEGLSRVRHPNLVCLVGCCTEHGEQYLVYEYCSSGNLAQHLLRKDTFLTWERRVKILRDCSLALSYLHCYIDGCIVHGNIKLTNILLTENLEPKLSDFGLAKMLGMEDGEVCLRGTRCYMDPEYVSNVKLTCARDIYSFGIVALQLLSGQNVIELDLDARDQLTRKAKDVSMGKRPLSEIKDPRLKENLNSMDYESILQIVVLCVAKSSKGRPTIDVVFDEMDKAWENTIAVGAK